MQVKSAIRAGQYQSDATGPDSSTAPGQDGSTVGRPYINKWYGGYHCHGKKDQYGNVSNATCRYIWPQHARPPV